jgi:hypothetical protein
VTDVSPTSLVRKLLGWLGTVNRMQAFYSFTRGEESHYSSNFKSLYRKYFAYMQVHTHTHKKCFTFNTEFILPVKFINTKRNLYYSNLYICCCILTCTMVSYIIGKISVLHHEINEEFNKFTNTVSQNVYIMNFL